MEKNKGKQMGRKKIVLGGGCFWCIEAVFKRVKGVVYVQNGYAGGARKNPTYENVCSGATGHAEVVIIEYDEDMITLEILLKIFFTIHDPTTRNQQGADKGTQYRSVIYYANAEEKDIITSVIAQESSNFENPIVTEVSPLPDVYIAEDYHQSYYDTHSSQGYCQVVIAPKIEKFLENFKDLSKDTEHRVNL